MCRYLYRPLIPSTVSRFANASKSRRKRKESVADLRPNARSPPNLTRIYIG